MKGKEKKETGIAGAIFMLILFLAMAIGYTISEADFLFSSKPVDVVDMIKEDGELEKGKYTSVTIDSEHVVALDWFAETKHYVNGIIPMGKERHCIICFDDSSLMALTVKGKKNIAKINKLIDYMYDYSGTMEKPDAVTFEGKISTMDSEILGYFRTGCNEYADLLKEFGYMGTFPTYELTLDASCTKLGGFALLGFCVLMVLISIWLLSSAIKNRKAEKLAAMSPALSYAENNQGNEFNQYTNQGGAYESGSADLYSGQSTNDIQQDNTTQNGTGF